MKTLEKIKDEVAILHGWSSFNDMAGQFDCPKFAVDEVAKRYALEASKESLRNAIKHVDVDDFEYLHKYGKCFKNVLSEENIPKEVKS